MIGDGNNFTFHNVSINTWSGGTRKEASETFTFHNVSINTAMTSRNADLLLTLHSTMFLLIPDSSWWTLLAVRTFTFHNVSINTNPWITSAAFLIYFTFHNVSINTTCPFVIWKEYFYFTFHNVSINTLENPILSPNWLKLYIPQCFY